MSGHRVREDVQLSNPEVNSTVNGETLRPTKWGIHYVIENTDQADSRVIAAPTKVGQRMDISVIANGGDSCYLGVSPGAWEQGSDTLLTTTGDVVLTLESFKTAADTYRWFVTYSKGTTAFG